MYGERFGFERASRMNKAEAKDIADVEKDWRQNYDITLVSVRRAA